MAKFRKKPVVIEADQLGESYERDLAIMQWAGGYIPDTRPDDPGPRLGPGELFHIHTPEGDLVASEGDWIIKGVKGEFYLCKPDIFAATYEPVEPDADVT